MVLIICTKNESNPTNRYWDMVPDRQKVWTDGMDGRRQNYIPPTSSGYNNMSTGLGWMAPAILKVTQFYGNLWAKP